MNLALKTHIALLSLLVPTMVVAQGSVPAVTGATARFENGQVVVRWEAVKGVDIKQYRVYHSTTSILQNDGLYDDFEVTRGSETELAITPPPGSTQLYAAVIAVSQNGDESPYFLEEASTMIGTAASSAFSSAAISNPYGDLPTGVTTISDTTLKVLRAEATTPEEIVVTFSGYVTVDPARAPEGLKIVGSNGSTLRIVRITISGTLITIQTEKQTKGAVYNVQFKEPFRGGTGLPLDPTDRAVLVTAHAASNEPTTEPVMRTVDPMNPPDVMDVRITPALERSGTYSLTVEWNVDNGPKDLMYLIAYQTRDAQTFGQPSVLPIDIRGVQLQGVTPGFYGLYLQTVNIYGYPSKGVFHYVNLPPIIPGQAMRGDILYGQIDIGNITPPAPLEGDSFEVIAVPAASGSLAAQVAFNEEATVTSAPEAAPVSMVQINWMRAAILAAAVAGVFVFIILSITLTQKMCRSKSV